VRKELIRPERTTLPGEDAFVFRNLLIRDSAYEALPKAQRAELHERFADWLERIGGDAIAEQEEIVAYHLEQAVRYRTQLGPEDDRTRATGLRASTHLASAGRRAMGRGDRSAAANLLRRALAVGPLDHDSRPAVLYDLADALEWIGDVRDAVAVWNQAVEAAGAAGDRRYERLARIRRSGTLMEADPHSESTDEFRADLEAAALEFERLGDDAALATVWSQLALIEWMPCRYEAAERAGLRALDHSRRSGDERLLADALTTLISAQMFGATTPEEGIRSIEELRGDLARSRTSGSFALTAEGVYLAMEGVFDEGRRLIGLGSEIAEGLGLSFWVAAAQELLGNLEEWAGDPVAAERAFRSNYEQLDRLADEGHKSTAAANLAHALSELGRQDEAERYAEIAREIAAEDDLASQVIGRTAQALVLAARGRASDAEDLAREGVGLFVEARSEAPNFVAAAWMDLARVLRAAAKPVDAAEAAREALALYERKGNIPASASTRAFIRELDVSV